MRLLDLIYRYWFRCLSGSLIAATILFILVGEHWTEAIFHALQFIVLNYEYKASPGSDYFWCLKALQFAVPAFASVGLLKNLFHEEISPLFVRTWARFQPPEAIVIGGGSVGRAISQQLATRGERVLIIDLRGSGEAYNPMADTAHGRSAPRGAPDAASYREPSWLRGDGRSNEVLDGANASRARKVFICTGADEVNLQVARQLFAFIEARPKPAQRTSVRVQLSSDDARRAVRDWLGWYSFVGHNVADVESFDIHEIAARELLIRYSPDRFTPTDHAGPVSQVVVVCGASPMAQELIRRVARIGHFSANGRLQVFWVDPDVDAASRLLRATSPHIDWQALPGDISGEWPTQNVERSVQVILVSQYIAEVMAGRVLENATGGRKPAVVWACHEDAARNAAEVRDLCAHLNRSPATGGATSRAVAVQFDQTLGLSDATENNALFAGFSCVPAEAAIIDYAVEALCNGQRDKLAKYIDTVIYRHGNYAADAAPQWAAQPEFIRDSNRDAADHTYIKLRQSGMAEDEVDRLLAAPEQRIAAVSATPSVPSGLERQVLDALICAMSIVEHRRYCAFMFAAGFTRLVERPDDIASLKGVHSLAQKAVFGVDNAKKHWERMVRMNPTLQPFVHLDGVEKNKDSDIVDHMFKLAATSFEVHTARKLVRPVQVSFASCAGQLQTLEGMVGYGAGAAIITGGSGEKWPVEASAFAEKYVPSDGLQMGRDGEYMSRALCVKAVQLPAPCTFALDDGRGHLSGLRHDWVVQHASGDIGVVARDIFERSYELGA
ncbi:MAG: PGDYG domain-containing protein [Pseudomonadota bacterium]